jgi:hypothetical protein
MTRTHYIVAAATLAGILAGCTEDSYYSRRSGYGYTPGYSYSYNYGPPRYYYSSGYRYPRGYYAETAWAPPPYGYRYYAY